MSQSFLIPTLNYKMVNTIPNLIYKPDYLSQYIEWVIEDEFFTCNVYVLVIVCAGVRITCIYLIIMFP